MTSPTPPTTRRSASGQIDRRTIVLSAAVMVAALLGGVLLVALTYDPAPSTPAGTDAVQSAPGIVPNPNEGTAPEDGGDRGGWLQIGLLVVIVGVIVAITLVVVKGGGAKARASRAAWKAAAGADHDGAVEP